MDTQDVGLDLTAWRALRAEGEPFTLPSGLKVSLKRVGVLDLAAKGSIPATLEPQLDQIMREGKVTNLKIGDFMRFAEMVDLVCSAALFGPEGLKVDELPYEDRVAIFGWANASGGKLQPFRKQAPEPLEPSHASNGIRTTPK